MRRTLRNSLTAQVRVRATPQMPVASIPLPVRYHWCAARPPSLRLASPERDYRGKPPLPAHRSLHKESQERNSEKLYFSGIRSRDPNKSYTILLPDTVYSSPRTFTRLGVSRWLRVASDRADTIIPKRIYGKVRFRIGTPKSVLWCHFVCL